MTSIERRLYLAGVTLFLFGLALGFAVAAFANKSGALTAHVTALGSGTFLIAIGVIWRKVDLGGRGSSVLAHALWGSFYLVEAGLTVLAARTPGQPSQDTAQSVAGVLNVIGAISMFIAVAAFLVFLIRSEPEAGTG